MEIKTNNVYTENFSLQTDMQSKKEVKSLSIIDKLIEPRYIKLDIFSLTKVNFDNENSSIEES